MSGQGSYVDDIKIPGMLHAAFLRSPHAHARIRSVDVAAALRMPGVEAVLTGDDILGIVPDLPTRSMSGEWEVDEFKAPEHPALAVGKVSYVGQTVAVVVAQDPGQARDALELIQVDYEPLPVVLDPWEAASSDSIPIHDELGTNVALRIHHARQGEDLDGAGANGDEGTSRPLPTRRRFPYHMGLDPRGTSSAKADFPPAGFPRSKDPCDCSRRGRWVRREGRRVSRRLGGVLSGAKVG